MTQPFPIQFAGDEPEERAAFEAAHPELAHGFVRRAEPNSDDYVNSFIQGMWEGWKARAELAKVSP